MDIKRFSVLFNASNLHGGGGIQVAASFVHELLALDVRDFDFVVWVSDEVADSLRLLGHDLDSIDCIEVNNSYGLKALLSPLNFKLARFDVVFSVFGPNYYLRSTYVDIVGFAQAWIVDFSAYFTLSFVDRLWAKIKFSIQKFFFKFSDVFVVELDHVRSKLCERKIAPPDSIHVVNNCISSLYREPWLWEDVTFPFAGDGFRVGCLGRDYVHKNLCILPVVSSILKERYGLEVRFFVTLNEREWSLKSDGFKDAVCNVGELSITQCPSFYRYMDAVFFPSFLECFSATPLEAMAMGKPLFASRRDFNKDICKDYAFYFDPESPEDAAGVIARYIKYVHGQDSQRLQVASEYAFRFSSAKERAEKYVNIVRDCCLRIAKS